MRSALTAGLAATVLVLAACGSDSGSSLGDDQQRVADILNEEAGNVGIELDSDCVNENIAELSDDDAKALADAGLEGDADISAEGEAIGDTLFTDCVDVDSYKQSIIDSISEEDDSVDSDCLADAVADLDTVEAVEEAIFSAAFDCIEA